MRGPGTIIIVLLVLLAGCRAEPSSLEGDGEDPVAETDAESSAGSDPSDPSDTAEDDRAEGPDDTANEDEPGDEEPTTPRDGPMREEASDGGTIGPYTWDLIGTSPDARHLVVQTMYDGCPRFEGWEHLEEDDRVVVAARMWQPDDPPGCDAVGYEERTVIELDEPLGDRELVGCQHGDCLTGSFTRGATSPGMNEVAATDDTLVVNAFDGQWSLDPVDGSTRLNWGEVGSGMLHGRAGPGVAMAYDGNLGIDVVDTTTGEVRFEVAGRFMGFAGDVFLSCRDRQEGDADGVSQVTEAHDVDTGELRWEVPIGCGQVFDTDGEVVTLYGRAGGQRPDLQLVVAIADGTERARVEVGPNAGQPVILDGEVFLYYQQGTFIAIDTTDGTVRDLDATGQLGGAAEGVLVVLDDGTEESETPDGAVLQGRSPDDAEVLWEREIDLGQARAVVAGDAVFVVDGPVGEVARLDPATGDAQWVAEVGRSYGADVAVHDGAAFVATTTAAVALELETGERRWWELTVQRP